MVNRSSKPGTAAVPAGGWGRSGRETGGTPAGPKAFTEALMRVTALPYVDEHTMVVAAEAEDVWRGLGATLDRSFSGPGAAGYARLVGCADRTAGGPRPLAEGSTLPGFRVAAAAPGRELVLMGRHRFSSYALIFRLEAAGPGRTRVRAESRAAFPGPAGALYRWLVIATGGHVAGMRRLLSGVRRRSEQGDGSLGGTEEAARSRRRGAARRTMGTHGRPTPIRPEITEH
ncbi:hypothetical protein SAVERM_4442 [Streptomyces avermitilis MA-4680 = NBRC 14893]|uniref:DUF2867 domain-containing protein n=2 Tax=Streptomyces avermitilis TaxID=33903 RepID=Q82F21_STRAW|nr:hypothetical protein SAVERM_4442 [Streptomyces avermitilis MA-4680 = NBRC 14893]